MKIRQLITSLILLAFSAMTQAQVIFRHWDESKGLPSDQIRSFSALDDGRMSIRIPNGLIIFDGADFNLHYIDRSRQYPFKHHQKNIYTNYKDSSGRLWLKSPGYLTLFDPVRSNFIYDVDSILKNDFGLKSGIHDMFIDREEDIWFVTADNRLLYHDSKSNSLVNISRLDGEWAERYGSINDISTKDGRSIICTSSGILMTWDKKRRQFTGCDENFKGKITDPDKKFRITFDSKGRKWAMYDTHVWMFEESKGQWSVLLSISGNSNFFTSIAVDSDDNIWAASSWSGLRIIDGSTLAVTEYPTLFLESGDRLSNDIQDINIDRNNGVWIGTLWQGVAYYHKNMSPFRTFHTGENTSRRSNESVRAIIEEANGDMLIATSFNGIVRYRPSTGAISQERPDIFPKNDVYMCLYRDSYNALWVGTYINGFIRVMPDGRIERYNYNPNASINVSRAVYEDKSGNFWVSVNDNGIGKLDLHTGRITMLSEKHPRLSFHKREYGFAPFAGDEFMTFGESGIAIYSPSNDELFIPQLDGLPGHRYHVACNGALVDTRGLAWYATDDGVFASDFEKYGQPEYSDIHLTEENSLLPSNYVSSIIEDKFGQIWLTTASGLARIIVRPDNDGGWRYDFTTYLYGEDLNAGRVSENAAFMSSSGDIYIGAYNGVIRFNPMNLASLRDSDPPSPLITGLSVFGQKIKAGDKINGRAIFDTSLLNGQEIILDHDENFLSIRFSSLDFISGPHKHYKYRLKGYDPDWVELNAGAEPQAIYTGLPSGTYEFEVIASGIDGIWTTVPASFTITIRPPLWKTWWAYGLYSLAVIAVIILCVRSYNSYRNRKLQEEAKRRELMQREQLNQMKFQFFTNISHEFRTPLALIMTPLSHILQNEPLGPGLKKKLSAIYGNAENLLGQVNRLLDFRKLEMGGEKLNLSRCRIVQFVSYLISSFDNITADRQIALSLESRIPEDTDIYVDTHKLRHILTNLYSNAIKFTPEGGSITTEIEFADTDGRQYLSVSVCDTGIGISEKDMPNIFNRFYQANNPKENPSGSGIGLHLVREYVRLHGGTISASSKPGEGTTFTFTVPMDLCGQTAVSEAAPQSAEATTAEEDGKATGKKAFKILIAEDNKEFREFLSDYLSSEYEIETATDGVDALEKARRTHPDVIVTDLMMPRMDGLELIAKLKHDIATSHIPVILLTAKASDESRIESYKAGADSYISKPFNYDVLHARVKMLLEQARKRQTVFRKDAEIEPSAVTITSIDEKMVQKALETVEKNMDNSSFSTTQLGEALGLSRSQLYRKFESVSGMSPADFIQRMRLKRAAQLLRDTRLNVSEIADMTGFNSIKYFNRHFKEEFSQTPTEYRSTHAH